MLKRLVTYFLGPWGMKVLVFYIEYSVWFNSIILVYTSLLFLSYTNYKRILIEVIQIVNIELDKNPRKKKTHVSWEEIIRNVYFIPLVANKMSFIPKRCTSKNIEEMINREKAINDLKNRIVIINKLEN